MDNQISPENLKNGAPKSAAEQELEGLKARMQQLESELKKGKTPERINNPEGKAEIIKQEIKGYIQELQKTPSSASPIATRDQAKEIKKFPKDQQVGALISLAIEKGLKEAVQVAKNLDNPAIMDEFHDALINQYYEKIKEVKTSKK